MNIIRSIAYLKHVNSFHEHIFEFSFPFRTVLGMVFLFEPFFFLKQTRMTISIRSKAINSIQFAYMT